MLNEAERREISRIWKRKEEQDAKGLPQSARHRNLEPDSAEFLHALATGVKARNILEIGGSSGLSTIALASAAREIGGTLETIEIEPERQAEAKATLARLGSDRYVHFHLGDAAKILPGLGVMDLVLVDCEKEDYIRFFDMLKLHSDSIVVADNILSHNLTEYVQYVRSKGLESLTLTVGKGLEVSRAVRAMGNGKGT